jgi:predicted  nucleic acid-binding Zn-ribbon protein
MTEYADLERRVTDLERRETSLELEVRHVQSPRIESVSFG